MAFETVRFIAAFRGFHVYRKVWQPLENESLDCLHEPDNIYDMFAIKTCRNDCNGKRGRIVGHLPIEVSRLTTFLLDRGAAVSATLISTRYRSSPLVQGGLEIQCVVEARMIGTRTNKTILSKYLELVNKTYSEPSADDTTAVGTFLPVNKSAIATSCITLTPVPKKKQKKQKSDPKPPRTLDIRDMLRRQNEKQAKERSCENDDDDDEVMIVSTSFVSTGGESNLTSSDDEE